MVQRPGSRQLITCESLFEWVVIIRSLLTHQTAASEGLDIVVEARTMFQQAPFVLFSLAFGNLKRRKSVALHVPCLEQPRYLE